MSRRTLTALICVLAWTALSACGKKDASGESIPQTSDSCSTMKAEIQSKMVEELQATSNACNKDSDCTVTMKSGSCLPSCEYIAISQASVAHYRDFLAELDQSQTCRSYSSSGCTSASPMCTAVAPAPACVAGKCRL